MFTAAVEQYFVCEAAGTGIECDHSDINQYTYAGPVSVSNIMFGLAPVVNLVFVLNWTAAKATLKSKWPKFSEAFSYAKLTTRAISANVRQYIYALVNIHR